MKSKYFNLSVGMTAAFGRASASFDARDESTLCPASPYEAENGQHFTPYCGRNLLAPEIGNQAGSSVSDCIEACSNFSPACLGVVYYIQNQTCSFKGEGVDKDYLSMTDSSNVNSALANATEMKAIKTTCPYLHESTTSIEGLTFQIQCDHDMAGYGDYIPWGHSFRQHAGEMSECMDLCVRAHPLCVGVSWNPDKHLGMDNCWLKNSQDGNLVVANNGTIFHSGLLDLASLPKIDACSKAEQISSNNKTFNTTCSEGRAGSSNISSSYSSTMIGCIDQCAAHDEEDSGPCLGVLYDNSFHEGFYNCYLLNATGSRDASQNFTYAELVSGNSSSALPSTPAVPSSTPSSGSDDAGSSSSKAWIAGPVIGAVAAVVIVVAGWFWWRRRRMTAVQEQEKQPVPVEVGSRPRMHELPPHYQISEVEGTAPRHELES
ncbi:hypothetical protein PISL3812_01227 [Talaromyces islandicus]|uniref:Apple domain-containing protein n=1 Tax=Talaromyces islandicus TaxID=28573 RepID=A0A0U1LNZ9_TALIS|nr:hypothetical protein PISL3812_01227 [Talaromyces islandicus]